MPNHLASLRVNMKQKGVTTEWLWSLPLLEVEGGEVNKRYRYWKQLVVDPANPRRMLVVLLCPPPPTYSAKRTITEERLRSRARLMGFGYVGIVYLFARKETAYSLFKRLQNFDFYVTAGELNDDVLRAALPRVDQVFFAYGKAPKSRPFARLINIRAIEVLTICAAYFRLPWAFEITMDGWPSAPIMVPFSTPIERWYPPDGEPIHPRTQSQPSIREGLY